MRTWSASTSTWRACIAKGLFDDPAKIEFVRQAEAALRVSQSAVSDKVDVTIQFMTEMTAGRAQQGRVLDSVLRTDPASPC